MSNQNLLLLCFEAWSPILPVVGSHLQSLKQLFGEEVPTPVCSCPTHMLATWDEFCGMTSPGLSGLIHILNAQPEGHCQSVPTCFSPTWKSP